jgi:hypothetical protein
MEPDTSPSTPQNNDQMHIQKTHGVAIERGYKDTRKHSNGVLASRSELSGYYPREYA